MKCHNYYNYVSVRVRLDLQADAGIALGIETRHLIGGACRRGLVEFGRGGHV